MLPKINLLNLRNISILDQLKLEESLLRADHENWCIINTGSSPAIVMGISGKPELLINKNQYQQNPIPLIRRFSGGGTVVVDEETLFVTFICKETDVGVPKYPQSILKWTEDLYKTIFPDNFRLVDNDYALGSRKCGGNAQYLCKDRWLHHTSFLWDYRDEMMDYLLLPPKMPAYRQSRAHVDFLCRLRDYSANKEEFLSTIAETLHTCFKVEIVSWNQVLQFLDRPHRKSTELLPQSAQSHREKITGYPGLPG